MSSVRQKEVNNVFVHYKCECACWRYSKKKKKQQQSKKQYTVKSTIDYIDYGFRVSSKALLYWISEIGKKKQKPLKLTLTYQMEDEYL